MAIIIDKTRIGKVLAVYGSASFVVLQVIDLFEERLSLPDWLFAGALVLLLIGLPVIITTTLVQSNDFKSALIERHFTWRRAIGAGIAAFLILGATAAFYARDRFGGDEPLDANLVAVFPFRVSGADASLSYLKEGMVDLLGAKLSGDVGTRAADTRATLAAWRRIGEADPDTAQLVRAARSIGARRMILGAVVGTTSQITVTASVTDTRTGRTVQHFVTGPAEQLPQKVDELIAALLSLDAREPLDRLAALTSTSLPATRAYLLAEENFRRGLYLDASKRYVEALNADSTFALSALGLIVSSGWDERIPADEVVRARKLAWAHRDRLSALDQLVLTGQIGPNPPEPAGEVTRCAVFPRITKSAPDRAQQWHDAADCNYHFWRVMGLANRNTSRTQFEKSLALDSTFVPNIQHLLALAAERRDATDAKRLARLFFAQDSSSPQAPQTRWYVLYAENRPNEELLAATDSMITTVGFDLALWANDNVEDAALVDSLYSRTLNRMRAEYPDDVPPSVEYSLAMMRGNEGEVRRVFERGMTKTPSVMQSFTLVAGLYADFDSTVATQNYAALEAMIAKPAAERTPLEAAMLRQVLCNTEQWRLWNGDASRTESVIRTLRAREGDATDERAVRGNASSAVCAAVVEAIRATVTHRPDARAQALRVDSISATAPYYANASLYMRLVASRLLEMNGEPALALTAARRMGAEFQPQPFYMAELLQDARLSAKVGDRERAIRNYRRYLAFRSHATGKYARSTEQVRRELAALIDN